MSGDRGSPTIAVGTYPCTYKGARHLWWGFELPRLDVDPADVNTCLLKHLSR